MWGQRRSERERRREQCREKPVEATWKGGMFYFCIQPVQLWVILPQGRLIACWFNVLSPPVPENQHVWWVMGLWVFFFSAGQELMASSNLNIHKSKKRLWAQFQIRRSITILIPPLSALKTRPLRVYQHCSHYFRILSLSLCPSLFLLPSRAVRQISEQLINEFNARIHAHIMCQLEKEPQLQGRSYNLDGH